MSYLIKKYKNMVLTKKREEHGIKIGADSITLPIKLNEEENNQLLKDIEAIGYKAQAIDAEFLQQNYEFLVEYMDWERGISCIKLNESTKKDIEKKVKTEDTLAVLDTKINTRNIYNFKPFKHVKMFIEKTEEGIRIKEYFPEKEMINELIEKTILKTKLIEHWMEKGATEPETEERIRYITTGEKPIPETQMIKETEQAQKLSLETTLQTSLKPGAIPERVEKAKTKKYVKEAFAEMDQELTLRIQQMKPKGQLKTRKQLEYLMWQDFTKYKELNDKNLGKLKQKIVYWNNLELDTSIVKEKIRNALSSLEKRARKEKEKYA